MAIEIYVPKIYTNCNTNYPVWFNIELILLIKLKKAYHAEWQKHIEDDKLHEAFKKTRAQCIY